MLDKFNNNNWEHIVQNNGNYHLYKFYVQNRGDLDKLYCEIALHKNVPPT